MVRNSFTIVGQHPNDSHHCATPVARFAHRKLETVLCGTTATYYVDSDAIHIDLYAMQGFHFAVYLWHTGHRHERRVHTRKGDSKQAKQVSNAHSYSPFKGYRDSDMSA